ncbi:MAG: HAD family hydrolase [Verrucomicrobiota bacterium]
MSAAFHGVEFSPRFSKRPDISHVVFDFDGTLSWLRHGWPEIMFEVFRERLAPRPGESDAQIRALLMDAIIGLNGKPTIFQMMRFAEIQTERGAPAPDPEALRAEYQRRLDDAIERRSQRIRNGAAAKDDFVVFGARRLIEHLLRLGITPIILSSTVEERVKAEAQLLDLARYFGRHIYGGVGDPTQFSKLRVFERLLREENITGAHLLSFGDGPVEIHNTVELGGLAIAVCSDENVNGSGKMDEFKRAQLLAAGAHAAIADYRDAVDLFDHILTP